MLHGCGKLRSLPPSIGGLTKLKVLKYCGHEWKNFRRFLEELQHFLDFISSSSSSLSSLAESFG